jgi:predicted amidophosphoribosyltransferase
MTGEKPVTEVRCLNCKTQTKSTTEVCRKCGDPLKSNKPRAANPGA